MESYKIRVEETVAVCDKPIPYYITKGAIGIPLQIRFTPEWENLAVTMVCAGSDVIIDVLLTLDNLQANAIIPWECLTKSGKKLFIGFYGTNGETLVIPTVWANMGLIYDAADPSGDPSTDPTLPVYAQLQQKVDELAEEIETKTIHWKTWED